MNAKYPFMLSAILFTGCATGFDRASMVTRLQNEDLQVTDNEVSEVVALKPQLTFPCRIAVHLSSDRRDWRWTLEDKKAMSSWADSLRQEGIVSDVILMPSMFTPDDDGTNDNRDRKRGTLRNLRAAAARYGADALLVLRAAAEVDNHWNPAGVANLTVLGASVIPGSTCDALFMLQGCLVDVHNGIIYATVESEGESKLIRPTFFIEPKDAVAKAKEKALADIGPELIKHMRNLREAYAVTAR